MKILTDAQYADLQRRHRILKQDLAEVERDRAELARQLCEERRRNDRNKHIAGVYVGLALSIVAGPDAVEE